jgi:hypothetical protein
MAKIDLVSALRKTINSIKEYYGNPILKQCQRNFGVKGVKIEEGWYRIAESSSVDLTKNSNEGALNTMFAINTTYKDSGNGTSAIFSVTFPDYNGTPHMAVHSFAMRNNTKNTMPKCRVVYLNGKLNDNTVAKRYLDVYVAPDYPADPTKRW